MRNRILIRSALIAASVSIVILAGCSAGGDPFEGMNRFFFDLNRGLDHWVGQPLAHVYVTVLPEPVRDGLHNAFDNLGYLNVVLNSFLQGKVDQGFQDAARMLVNSTLGIAGIFDVATGMGLERHDEDFGQTLAVWGVEQGPYLVLPILGPSTTRDVWSVPVAIGTNPLFYFNFGAAVLVVGGFKAIDGRARADEKLRQLEEAALDPYVFTRVAFLARREYLVHDGNPPSALDEELYEDFDVEDFDDEEPEDEAVPDAETDAPAPTSAPATP